RFAAVLAADPDFEIFAGSAAQLGRHLDELADAFLIEHRERVGLKDFGGFVVFLEPRIVVAGETHGGLREVVGAEGEELGLFGDLIGGEGGAGDFDHRPDHVVNLFTGFGEDFIGHANHDGFLVVELFDAADERNHDFGQNLNTLLRYLNGGFEDGAGLHLGDLRVSDAETAAAMAEHGVEFVQVFHAVQEIRKILLQILHSDLVALRHVFLQLDVGMGEQRDIDHKVFALRQEFVERRIKRADHDRKAVHRFEETGEVTALHRQEFG